jgi:integrase
LSLGEHPTVVQERLGHSTIGVTMDTLSLVLPDLQRGAASTLDALFAAEAE